MDKGRTPFDVPTRANILQSQRLIEQELREKAARDSKLSPLDKAYAALEAARTIGSGVLATIGSLPTRAIKGEDAAQQYINQRMFIPTTEKGMDYVGNVGDFLEQLETKYKLPPVLPEAVALQNLVGPASKQAAKTVKTNIANMPPSPPSGSLAAQRGVIKMPGGNWLKGNIEPSLEKLKSPKTAGQTQAERIPLHERLLQDPALNDEGRATVQRHLDATKQAAALDNWVDRNLTNYVKKEMATPNDPVRLMFERRAQNIEAQFQVDMGRAERTRARAEAETDPRRQANLMRQAEQQENQAKFDRDFAAEHITHLPKEEDFLRLNSDDEILDDLKNKRKQEGFDPKGMAQSEPAKRWESLSDESIWATQAKEIQKTMELVPQAQQAERAFKNHQLDVSERFDQHIRSKGLSENQVQTLNEKTPISDKARIIGDTKYDDLLQNYTQLRTSVDVSNYAVGKENPWINKVNPETPLYSGAVYDLGFDHVLDVLRQDLAAGRITPEQLNKISMEQAIQRTAEFNMEQAKKMRETAIKQTEGMPIYKDYADKGYKWIELAKPKDFTELPSSHQLESYESKVHGGTGYRIVNKETGMKGEGFKTPEQATAQFLKSHSEERLADALKYEGDTMGHCVGGYCPDVLESRSRIFSLRDAKGEPHVTVEIQPHNPNLESVYAKQNLPELYAKYSADRNKYFNSWPEFLKAEAPELLDATENKIVQIKGKQNRAPKEEYLPFVQDFVKSGNWSDVGDLQNTGLRRTSDAFNETEQAFLKSKGVELKPYIEPEETARYQELFKQSPPTEGMKRGGKVSISDNCDCQMMEIEDKKFAVGGIAKAAKKAAKTAKPALPLDLPRAPAKTKEEIRPIAQRMAQQMTGEFVRPDPKKSVNPAGKSLKQFQMEQQLQHDIRPTVGSNLSAQQIADIEKQMGMLKIGVSGDTTIADQTLHRAGPYELDLPSPQHGGPLYGLGGEGAWASNNPVAATFQKRVQELSQAHGDAPVLGQFLAMGPSGSNFAMHFADANLRAIDISKMNQSQIDMVNDLIRAGTKKSGPRPAFPGIEDKESAYLHFAVDPELRKHFNAIMQKPDYTTKLGLPDGRVILHAITEPELRNTEILTSGLSQMRLDPSVDPSTLSLSAHPTYSHVIPKVPNSEIGKTKYLIPAEMEFPDVAEYAKKNYRPEDLTRVYQTATPRQMIDQQHIDEIKMYEEMMKELTGKKKGGAISKDQGFATGGMIGKAVKSAIAARELEKQAILRAEAAAKSAAKQALMPQYNEAVKGQTQKQNPPSFEQWKAANVPQKQTLNLSVKPPSDNIANVIDANFYYPKKIGNQTVKIGDLSGGVRMNDPTEAKRVKDLAEKMSSPDGYISRIIVDHNNNVIEGQHRLEALRQLGMEDVPVYKIEDLSETMPVNEMESAVNSVGGIHPDNAYQLVRNALEHISEGNIDSARQMNYGKWQKHYDAALNAIVPKVSKASGGAVYNTYPDMSDGGQMIQGAPFKKGGNVNDVPKPKFIPLPAEFDEPMFNRALDSFRGLANQGLNATFPLRKIVSKASNALLDDWQERTINKNPDAYLGKHAEYESDLANFHIKNAIRKKFGIDPIALPNANIEDIAVLNSFPETIKKAGGGDVNLDAMYMAVNDAKFRRK